MHSDCEAPLCDWQSSASLRSTPTQPPAAHSTSHPDPHALFGQIIIGPWGAQKCKFDRSIAVAFPAASTLLEYSNHETLEAEQRSTTESSALSSCLRALSSRFRLLFLPSVYNAIATGTYLHTLLKHLSIHPSTFTEYQENEHWVRSRYRSMKSHSNGTVPARGPLIV